MPRKLKVSIRVGRLPGFDDTNWPEAWLNEEQTTIRHWQMIGPFPNEDNNGFAKNYRPEQEFDPHKKYDGLEGQVGWEDYNGNEPYLALNNWDIWMKTEGGEYVRLWLYRQLQPRVADGWA